MLERRMAVVCTAGAALICVGGAAEIYMGGAAVMRMGGVAVILHERSRGDLCGRTGSDCRIGGDGPARWHGANGSTRTWPPYKLADSLPYESTAGLPSY